MTECRIVVDGVDTFFHDAGEGEVPIVCVHGNLDSADAWRPLLDQAGRLGRVIAPDLPCFGRSSRPDPALFDASLDAYVDWFEHFVDALGLQRYRLVVHDWGSLALAAASRHPTRVERLVAIDTVPLTADYRWHWIARLLWRPPVIGEFTMTVSNRVTVKLLTRLQRPGFRALDEDLLDRMTRHLDPGMKRAILRLYRSAGREDLARHGAGLADLTAPALVVWGNQDPYVGTVHAGTLAAALGGTVRTRTVDGGHWPMCDSEEVFALCTEFLLS